MARTEAQPEFRSEVRIGAARGGVWVGLAELVQHRELVYFLAWRDVKLRYRQTALGVLWAILQPLLAMAVLVAALSRLGGLTSGTLPYAVSVYAGMLLWMFLANTALLGSTSLAANPALLTFCCVNDESPCHTKHTARGHTPHT